MLMFWFCCTFCLVLCLDCTVYMYLCRVDVMLRWCANFFQNAVFCSYEQVSVVKVVQPTHWEISLSHQKDWSSN